MDLWLFFGLVLPFLAFILEVIEEIIEEKQESIEKDKTVDHFKVTRPVYNEGCCFFFEK